MNLSGTVLKGRYCILEPVGKGGVQKFPQFCYCNTLFFFQKLQNNIKSLFCKHVFLPPLYIYFDYFPLIIFSDIYELLRCFAAPSILIITETGDECIISCLSVSYI